MSFATPSRPHRGLAAATVLFCLATPPALAEAASANAECSRAYHSALQAVAARELPKLESSREVAFEGDPVLPGGLIFRASSRQRSEAEMAALREANSLARRRGRARWVADGDSRWIADQIRRDLATYLEQPHSPYLCGGVSAYLETLRSYAARIEASPARRREWSETQERSAARALDAALGAMKPAPLPRYAPADRPAPAIAGLRPAIGLDRTETHSVLEVESTDAKAKAAPAPAIVDPDLPPLSAKKGVPLGTDRERIAALDSLISAASSGGFMQGWNSVETGKAATPSNRGRPVLARLEVMQTLVSGPHTPIGDRLVRSRFAAALAEIEALDYLAKADANGPDPMLAAIEATLDAIGAAHAEACGCGEERTVSR